jgi:hypothetical protein
VLALARSLIQRRLNLTVPAEVVFTAASGRLQVARPIRESAGCWTGVTRQTECVSG